MRRLRSFCILFACFCSAASLIAQSTTSPSPQALTVLQGSYGALTGTTVVSDVTLTGSAEWIAGSDDEIGAATFKSVATTNRLDLALRSGTRSEIRSIQDGLPSGTWIGPDGTSHAMANHNVMTDAGWFPAFTLGNLTSSSNTVLTYVGQETRNGASVIHISASQPFPSVSGDPATLPQHLTQVDIYLDPTSLLPVSYAFSSHPDNNAAQDVPTEIRYFNYQKFGGAQIPLHVQKYINNALAIDLQFQNASLNTGITAAQMSAQ